MWPSPEVAHPDLQDGRSPRRGQIVARWSAAVLVVLGGLVLAGWSWGVGWLRGPIPGAVEMKFNTASAFVVSGALLGVAGGLPARRIYATGYALGAGVLIVLGVITLMEYGLEQNLGIDEFWVADTELPLHTVHPGRMDPQTAAGFVLGGLGLIALRVRALWQTVDYLGAVPILLGFFSLIAYAYQAPTLAHLPGVTPIAPHTAAGLVVLGIGLLTRSASGRLVRLLSGHVAGSVMARRLLPLTLVGFPVLGFVRLAGERAGLYPTAEGTALMVVADVALVTVGIFLISGLLNRAEATRAAATEAQRRLAAVVNHVDEPIISVDEQMSITSWNTAAERLLGYQEAEIIGQPLSVLLPDDRRGQPDPVLEQLARHGSGAADTQRRHRDGTLVDVAITASPIRLGDRAVGACAVYHDIAERNRARDRLEEEVRDRTAELAASRAETLQRLAYAAEYRDNDTYHHTERVGHLAALLAARSGLSADHVALVRQAAPLHDVGKIAIPDAILLKAGGLTDEEFDVVKSHTIVGARILKNSSSAVLRLAERIALYHHERWDGDGYPMGLHGHDIPMAARIVAVADVYDALTHNRPYKTAWTHEQARAEIEEAAGTQFDPEVVAAFLALSAEEISLETPPRTTNPQAAEQRGAAARRSPALRRPPR